MLRINNISKSFEKILAVDNVSLEINNGEFFALLGPSGCGKTTLLRIISGFEKPDNGQIYISDNDITFNEPFHRPTNLLFQNYALFPHLNVYKNISYGLEQEKIHTNKIKLRVEEIIERTDLNGLENRTPDQLSGGQKQRVALARCLVKKPKVLLLDEPLSALDKNLKELMKIELKKLQNEFGITFIMVTHDQDEALVMADRIAIMKDGKIIQLGTPKEIYDQPTSFFTANFIGQMNFINAKNNKNKIVFKNGFEIINSKFNHNQREIDKVGLRPEDISLKPMDINNDISFKGIVKYVAYHGKDLEVTVKSDISEENIVIRTSKFEENIKQNDEITCYASLNSIRIFY